MAKKKDKGETDGVRIPKKVAGVKIPKELRRKGNKVIDLMSHPLVADIAAAALTAAAAALRGDRKGSRSRRNGKDEQGEKAGETHPSLAAQSHSEDRHH